MKNKEKLDKLIKSEKEDVDIWTEKLLEANNKYIGETLEREERQLSEWISEAKLKIEAYELLLAKEE